MTNSILKLFFFSAPQSHFAEKWLAFAASTAMRVTVVFAATFVLSFCFRRASAAIRHLFWVSTFCAVLALPGLLWVVPAWRIHASSRICLLYTSPSPRDLSTSRMPSSA